MIRAENREKLQHDMIEKPVYNTFSASEVLTGSSAELDKKAYAIMVTFAYVNTIVGCSFSCLAPFFPKEAEAKGLTPSVYGFLIAIQELVIFILAPVIGVLLPKLGIRLTMLVGSIMGTIGVTCFGALVWAPHGTPFAVSCALVRLFGSIGMANLSVCIFAAVPIFFSDHVSQTFGLLEMCFSVGTIIGPLAGGLLYEFGGFGPPFYVFGGLLALSFPLILFICPEMKDSIKAESKAGIIRILSDFRITVNLIGSFIFCLVSGFMQVSLEPHIRSFADLRSSTIGAIFLVFGLFYGVSTWLVGLVLPKIKDANFISIIGLFLIIIAYLFNGPMYPIPIKPLTSLKDDPDVSGLISSLFVSVFSLGIALGPIVGGQLTEHFTYQQSCIFIVGISTATLLLTLGTIIFHKRR